MAEMTAELAEAQKKIAEAEKKSGEDICLDQPAMVPIY